MRYSNNYWCITMISLGFWLSACHTQKRVTLDEVTISAKDEDYRAAADRVWDITHTKVALSFNWKEKTANGHAWLSLHPYFYATDSLELDAKSMKVDSVVLVADGMLTPLKFLYENDRLKLKFSRKYNSGDSIHLYIVYTAMPYQEPSGGSAAISEDRGLYFINTDNAIPGKPVQIWTQGETESNSHWMPTIDKPNERFTTQIELTVPDSFNTLSNGYLSKQVNLDNNLRTDIWKMDKPIQTYAVTFVIGKYAIVKDEWRGKEVSYYVEPEYKAYARKMFDNTPEMIEYYSGITGISYPWNKYAQVVVRDYVSGAMENTTATTFGEYINQNFRQIEDRDYEFIVAHELFHQWFGDYVTAESWSNITVNESFANYGEYLWTKHKYGKVAADDAARNELWNYVYGQAQTNDPALVRFHYKDREAVFDRVSYQKGGAILRYLHGLIGDSAFYKSMNLYLTRNALQPAEATNWRLAIEEITGQDWNWFFNQWYYKGGHPKLEMDYNYDDDAKELTVVARQKQKDGLYRLPLKTWLIYGDSVAVVDWDLQTRNESFSYKYAEGQKPIVVADAEHWLVGEIDYNLTPEQWLQVFRLSTDNIVNKRLALGAAKKEADNTAGKEILDLGLKDSYYSVRLLALSNISELKGDKWKELWRDTVLQIANNDKNNQVRAMAFYLLGMWNVKDAKQDMLHALNDSSYAVAGAALDAFNKTAGADKDTAYIIAKKMLEADDLKGDLRSAVWMIIAKNGNASDADLFEQHFWEFYGPAKIELASDLSEYMKFTVSNSAFDKALLLLVQLHETENISSYRSAIADYLFATASTYKKMLAGARSKSEEAEMQDKYDKIKRAVDVIIDKEQSENNRKKYRNYRKIIFGNS